MKKLIYLSWALILMSIIACTEKINIEKEEDAIKNVIEEEKNAFINQDSVRVSTLWVHKPSSLKIYMTEDGPIEFLGWDKIFEHDKENMSEFSSDNKNTSLIFSDYLFNIYNNNAWLTLKATWDGIYKGEKMHLEQKRILAFEKIEGKWKYTLMAIYNIPPKK